MSLTVLTSKFHQPHGELLQQPPPHGRHGPQGPQQPEPTQTIQPGGQGPI